ncbi:MAG: galactokinase [Clostridiales bacterium]|nr:galactokinase [Clostridiales bacterium]
MDNIFAKLYGDHKGIIKYQRSRYRHIFNKFQELFPESEAEVQFYSTPGRTEIGGNHTDHNHGRVLAAGVDLDSVAAATKSGDSIITVHSRGYEDPFIVDTYDLEIKDGEKRTTNALIRGIAARFKDLDYKIGGFNAYISSDVLGGSGLSSSASIEVLFGTILNHLYNEGKMGAELLAIIGQYAENVYFDKPSGLMDQIACAVGGFVSIDFKDPLKPIVKEIKFDFEDQDYQLLIVNTGGNHADLTDDYASIPIEMMKVANVFDKNVCRELTKSELLKNIGSLREKTGDRAVLRAMHFFDEDNRVILQTKALEKGRFDEFLSLVKESGNSSWKLLQNCFTTHNPEEQGITLGLAITEDYINKIGKGACRIHGGGFAGTIQVFLPDQKVAEYIKVIESVFGVGSVTKLGIRSLGTIRLDMNGSDI